MLRTPPPRDLASLLTRRRAVDARLADDPQLARRARELRAWQAQRLAATYADLRSEPSLRPAIEFFLAQVYGPQDFTRRDDDLARASRILERTLPAAALEVLCAAAELDALSRELDVATTLALGAHAPDDQSVAAAYRAVGRRAERDRQIDLIIGVGERLEHIVRHRWIGAMLRLARGPADAAGFGALQDFLESGFAAFRLLGDARRFLTTIEGRERALMDRVFATAPDPFGRVDRPAPPGPRGA